MVFSACSNHGPGVIGPQGGKLAPCPDRPNCVCSDAADPRRRVAPFALQRPAAEAWQALEAHLTTLRRVQLVTVSPFYLHAVFRSRVFGFSDDVEFYLGRRPGKSPCVPHHARAISTLASTAVGSRPSGAISPGWGFLKGPESAAAGAGFEKKHPARAAGRPMVYFAGRKNKAAPRHPAPPSSQVPDDLL